MPPIILPLALVPVPTLVEEQPLAMPLVALPAAFVPLPGLVVDRAPLAIHLGLGLPLLPQRDETAPRVLHPCLEVDQDSPLTPQNWSKDALAARVLAVSHKGRSGGAVLHLPPPLQRISLSSSTKQRRSPCAFSLPRPRDLASRHLVDLNSLQAGQKRSCTHLEMFGVRFHPKFSKIQQKHRSWRQGSKESKEAPRSAWSERPVRATRGREANHLRPPWPAASSAALDTPPVGEASRVPFFLPAHARVGRAEPQQEAARQTEQARSETARLAFAENEGGNDSAGG
mmetsp:Transcript_5167/g.18648  ORF Transcript_5167/g.18648 Transcript_5167/m.18648 type:complete len:285 (+) Transcript_5167:600-1454(+)